MKGILILVVMLVAGSHCSFAQYWNLSGSNINNSNTGNVGIGTTTPPDAKLTIQSTTTGLNSGLLIKDASLNPRGALYFANTGQDFVIDALSAPSGGDVSTFKIRTGAFDRFNITRDGNVGIGTTSPQAKFHIFGGRGLVEHPTESSIQYKATTISQYWDVGTNYLGYYIYENTSGKYNLVINKNGNVGIGTGSPSQKLTVNGTIYSKEVKVDLSVPGPDYVFEENYNLPSLTDTENYIKQNKHLPEVPSACEMEENGINLSEMNMLLLKKVEELTLHLLKQEKTIAEQNQRLLKLENKD